PNPLLRALWRLYTRMGLPLIGRAISQRWASVGAFLSGSIEGFNAAHTQEDIERCWRAAGLSDVHVERMSFGAGVVMTAVKDGATEGPRGRGPWARSEAAEGSPPDGGWGYRRVERVSVAPSGTQPSVAPAANRTAFYALRPGGVRDYWTLLHPPYTVWHLSYVLLGAACAFRPRVRTRLGWLPCHRDSCRGWRAGHPDGGRGYRRVASQPRAAPALNTRPAHSSQSGRGARRGSLCRRIHRRARRVAAHRRSRGRASAVMDCDIGDLDRGTPRPLVRRLDSRRHDPAGDVARGAEGPAARPSRRWPASGNGRRARARHRLHGPSDDGRRRAWPLVPR